jgi:CPA2 family monovalent cation:H+ antiporter-2
MFSAIFFVAIGMLIQPKMLVEHALPITLITVLCVVGKVVACGLGTFLSGHGPRTSMRVGMGVAQIGEFSFIIATLGYQLKVTSDFLYPIAVTVSAITTLLTPYLIRHSDRVATAVGRVLPSNVAAAGEAYTQWANGAGGRGGRIGVRQVLRKLLLQMGLNMMLVSGLFVVAAWSARHFAASERTLPAWTGGAKAVFWLAAAILSMPLLIVTIRKLRAVSLVVAEAGVPKATAGENTANRRALVAGGVRVVGLLTLVIVLAALTAAVLPPWPVLTALVVIAGVVMALRWRAFERVYGRAQLALRETMTPDAHPAAHAADPDSEPAATSTILRNAALHEVLLPETSPASGKLIRELGLRTRTGATAVGIERAGLSVINPGPDEELLPGDRLLLLGSREQVDQARHYLLGEAAPAAAN